ncbi:MAG: N-acetyltransferase [Actinobacteria bacterium]|nr:N-acetyltransferase [Actinomycetota bacterium]
MRNGEWLTKWEPLSHPHSPDPSRSRDAFTNRCASRDRERQAGNAYMSEAVVVMAKFAFEELRLHRIEICIIPRNTNSLRVVEKIGLRNEGLAERFLEINGEWEDHYRFGLTTEEWSTRRDELAANWL